MSLNCFIEKSEIITKFKLELMMTTRLVMALEDASYIAVKHSEGIDYKIRITNKGRAIADRLVPKRDVEIKILMESGTL